MTHLRKLAITTIVCCGLFATSDSVAGEQVADYSLNGNADLCFAEAGKAVRGVDSENLSTMPCRRALRHESIGRADRSAMYHNRGIVEQAQGNLESAKASFARAVQLSGAVDKRNLALAQVAHRLGDLELAIRQYDLVIREGESAVDAASMQRVIANRRRAGESFRTTGFANR